MYEPIIGLCVAFVLGVYLDVYKRQGSWRIAFAVSLRSGPPFQNRGKCDAAQLSRLYQRG